ncbi:OmpA family protein [Photobacterium kagoshimensis]|uniref:OmpA family protein n=1 Tax=Photobacterium kagoshimensis TaxID=2910242 RepID=UPI003D12CD6B
MDSTTNVQPAQDELDQTGTWLSISDMMAGILMVFILLLITTLAQLLDYEEQSKNNRVIIIEGLQEGLYKADIHSVIDPVTGSLSLTESLEFDAGKYQLKPQGKKFLEKLIPIYSQVIFQSQEISDEVLYLVIEGHADKNEAPKRGLSLSVRRAEAVINQLDTMIFHYKGQFMRKVLPAGRGNLDADPELTAKQNRKVIFRFEFQSHDLTELIRKEKQSKP